MTNRRLSRAEWQQMQTAYAAGVGLRELARNMGIPAGTVLARAKREGWTEQIRDARTLATPDTQSPSINPPQSAAISLRERGKRYVEGMARVSEKVLPHVEGMQPNAILDRSADIERFDKVARRNLGLNETPVEAPQLTLTINQLLAGPIEIADAEEI